MHGLFKNSFTIMLYRLFISVILEAKYKHKKLKVSGSSSIKNCVFGIRNTIYNHVRLSGVSLGDYSYIANNSIISKTKIGKFCSIGPNSNIGLGIHPSNTFVSTHPIFFSTLKQSRITFADKSYFEEFKEINIGNDVWIGNNVIILDGVNIADGVIIAAGAVVTKDIPAYAIVGGVPAKIIKYRFDASEIKKLLDLKWWDMDVKFLKDNYKNFHDIKKFFG